MPINRHGFTLMELMVVVVVIGVVAAFGIPNYTRSIERAHRRDAENNLTIIHAAQSLFASRNNGIFWGPGNLAAINTALGLNIIANGMTYNCGVGGVGGFSCTAARVNGWAFTITVNQGAIVPGGVNPSCAPVASCP